MLGRLPENWTVLEFDLDRLPAISQRRRLLRSLSARRLHRGIRPRCDGGHGGGLPGHIASSLRGNVRPRLRSTLNPREVWPTIERFWSDEDAYLERARAGREFVVRNCGLELFASRISALSGEGLIVCRAAARSGALGRSSCGLSPTGLTIEAAAIDPMRADGLQRKIFTVARIDKDLHDRQPSREARLQMPEGRRLSWYGHGAPPVGDTYHDNFVRPPDPFTVSNFRGRHFPPFGYVRQNSDKGGTSHHRRPVGGTMFREGVARAICDDGLTTTTPKEKMLPAFYALMTRFNMAIFRDKVNLLPTDLANWSRNRSQIFTRICLPSVLRQVRRPDLWLIGFDAESPEAAEPALTAMKIHPWIVPVWQRKINGKTRSISGCFRRELCARVDRNFPYIVSTCMDSDDAMNLAFVHNILAYSAAVAGRLPEQEVFWLSYAIGVKYAGNECRLHPMSSNPFLSMIEISSYFWRYGNTVFIDHRDVFQKRKVFVVNTKFPMWLQHVHGANTVNRQNDKLILLADTNSVLRRFGIGPAPSDTPGTSQLSDPGTTRVRQIFPGTAETIKAMTSTVRAAFRRVRNSIFGRTF